MKEIKDKNGQRNYAVLKMHYIILKWILFAFVMCTELKGPRT